MSSVDSSSSHQDQPAFIIGITGHMDPGDPVGLASKIRDMFTFLRHGSRTDSGQKAATRMKAALAPLANLERHGKLGKAENQNLADTYEKFFKEWPGLGDMPIVVLSSLAPGADQIVAQVAMEKEFQDLGFHLRCPLPFPMSHYRNASTFVRNDTADQERLESLKKLVPADNDERCFTVAIEDELDLTPDEIDARYRQDLGDSQRRRRRYQAAGEYIAVYSNLLISIWDHVDDTKNHEGTAAIVHARRLGPTPGLLLTTSALPLPPEGPTFHLFTKRLKRKHFQQDSTAAESEPNWSVRWLIPYRKKNHIRELDANWVGDCDAAWQNEGLTKFVRTTELLLEFTRRDSVEPGILDQHLRGFLTCEKLTLYDRPELEPLIKIVRPVANLRRRATSEQRNKELPQSEMTIRWLFFFTLLSAILFDAFNHWHAQIELHTASDHAVDDTLPVIARLIRFMIGFTATCFAVWAIWFFRHKRAEQHDAKGHDLRALAEGARVQMLWHLAGVGRSVPANYMERQRSELNWIRKAIRSVSMPYEQSRRVFDGLQPETKIQLLKCVFHNWLRGHKSNAQANYFESAKHEKVHEIHFWHKVGSVLVISGLMMSLFLVASALPESWGFSLLEKASEWCWSHYLCWVLIAPAALFAAILYVMRRVGWRELQHKQLDPWIDRLIPTQESQQFAHDAKLFKWSMTRNFSLYACWSILLAGLAFLLGVVLQHSSTLLPGIKEWTIILSACLLILGGLSIAWPERNLFSEMAYQYGTMQSLFELAANKVELMIQELERQHLVSHDREAARRIADERCAALSSAKQAAFNREQEIAATQKESVEEFARIVRRIQEALYHLGQEALDENAEWLLLHRARPLEPVMAG